MFETRPIEPAMRLIIGYKLGRAALALAMSGLLIGLTATGHASAVDGVAERLRQHLTSAWSLSLADALIRAVVPRRILFVAAALAVDGLGALVEGAALRLGWWWGPWLVVGTTALFLPFEVVAIARHLAWGRVVLLVVNLAVALYLARRARRHTRSRRGAPPAS